jgi:hypothetical protein
MTRVRRLLSALLVAVLGAGTAGAAEPVQGDRSRTIEGWLVEDVAEQDGGRLVRLSRTAQGIRIQYSAAFWRGTPGRPLRLRRAAASGPGQGFIIGSPNRLHP